jgi:hypothetical protein
MEVTGKGTSGCEKTDCSVLLKILIHPKEITVFSPIFLTFHVYNAWHSGIHCLSPVPDEKSRAVCRRIPILDRSGIVFFIPILDRSGIVIFFIPILD